MNRNFTELSTEVNELSKIALVLGSLMSID